MTIYSKQESILTLENIFWRSFIWQNCWFS